MREYQTVATILHLPAEEDATSFILHKGAANDVSQGKLNLYEGLVENHETAVKAAARHLSEKSGLTFEEEAFMWAGFAIAESEVKGQGILLETEVYQINLPFGFAVDALKNSGLYTRRAIAKSRVRQDITNVSSAALSRIFGV